jgi:hypothetical protein
VAEVISASNILAPYVIVVNLYVMIGIPAGLLFDGPACAIPAAMLAYVATVAMLVRLWFLREHFSLSWKQFIVVSFESVVCLQLAAGIVRRLSLMTPIVDDLALFTIDMRAEQRIGAISVLRARCEEMANFYVEGSPESDRLNAYATQLTALSPGTSPEVSARGSSVEAGLGLNHDGEMNGDKGGRV